MAIKGYTAEENAAYRQKKQAEIEDMFKRIDEGSAAVLFLFLSRIPKKKCIFAV